MRTYFCLLLLGVAALAVSGVHGYCDYGQVDRNSYIKGYHHDYDCVDCPESCTVCTLINDEPVCTWCPPGQYLTGDLECDKCTENCVQCVGPTIGDCIVPAEGYGYNDDSGELEECKAECDYCPDRSASACYAGCPTGTYVAAVEVDGEVTCGNCPAGCISCYQGGGGQNTYMVCQSCEEGYALDYSTDVCVTSCPKNCDRCYTDYDNYCVSCIAGYDDDKGVCVLDDQGADNVYCDIGEYEEGGKCLSCPSNCRYCYDNTYCYSCYYDYDEDFGDCVPCQLDNCDSCGYDGERCYSCANGYNWAYDADIASQHNDGYQDGIGRMLWRWSLYRGNDIDERGYALALTDPMDWQEDGFYESCKACDKLGEGCTSCTHDKGICNGCELGMSWDSGEEACVDSMSGCLVPASPGFCAFCPLGYTASGAGCKRCGGNCATCVGTAANSCTTCPIDMWTYYTPYAYTGFDYGLLFFADYEKYAIRAPGPYDEGFVLYSMECVSECPEESEYGDKVDDFPELKTCWVEDIDEEDLQVQEFMPGIAPKGSSSRDLVYWAGLLSANIRVWRDTIPAIRIERDVYISLFNRKVAKVADCHDNGTPEEMVDPIGRIVQYCDCTDSEYNPKFYGPDCQWLYAFKQSANDKVNEILLASATNEPSTHAAAIDTIAALSLAIQSGVIGIYEISIAAGMIGKAMKAVDYDLYPFARVDIMNAVSGLAFNLQWHVISQLSFADKSYDWDGGRRMVGAVTEAHMTAALTTLARMYMIGYEGIKTINFGRISSGELGFSHTTLAMDEGTRSDGGEGWAFCSYNLAGRMIDGYIAEDEAYDEYHGCYHDNDEGIYTSNEVVVWIPSPTEEFERNMLFLGIFAQYVAVFLNPEYRAATDLIFYGMKNLDAEDVKMGDVEITLPVAHGYTGSMGDIKCAQWNHSDGSIDTGACSTEVDDVFDNRVICTCDSKYGWIAGVITTETATELIEDSASGGKYEVAFGAIQTLATFAALVWFYLVF